MKILIGTLLLILGLVGVLMEAAGNLPPELDIPLLDTILTIVGILILGLGWMDELESGKLSIIELVRKFFQSDPYRWLGLNLVIALANQIIDSGMFPAPYVVAAQLLLAVLAVFGFGAGYVKFRLKLYALRQTT